MSGSHHRHGQVRLSCLVGGMNRTGDKSKQFSVVLNILETEQFFQFCLWCERVCEQILVADWKLSRDKTKLCSQCISRLENSFKFSATDSLDLSPVLYTMPMRKDNKTDLSCPCRGGGQQGQRCQGQGLGRECDRKFGVNATVTPVFQF